MLCIQSLSTKRLGSYSQMALERSFGLNFPTSRLNTVRIKDDSDNVTHIRYLKINEIYYTFQIWDRTVCGSFVVSR